ncbi:thiamine pyrophosphate-binding protein [Actinomadura alba]|uniref:Thiamine pyrophosphate-binding protein n=1 Tax=Actinomadura alba TaxID=406431 RepID=A0ABR7LY14_9ACTN|nr:thiamine pyrophosphate-binding protein [Actinomadura alba]MBC6469360.1 thiamine pyrophosphate-binding protein [Actinomadura alba]
MTAGPTTADAVLDVLQAWGVDRVFICPGSTEAAFLDATLRRPDLEVVLTTHESVTVAMADGHARATGRPAVAYLHTHLGLVNGLSHLDAARMARSPVIVLNGLKPASVQSHGGFTTLPGTGELARPFVKRQWQSLTAEGVPEDLTEALRLATAEPTGPVWLGLAQDLMEAPATGPVPDPARHLVAARVAPDPERVSAAARLLTAAQRPVLVAGAEVARHGAHRDLVRLAERTGAVVFNEDRRSFERPAFPTGHPQYAGNYSAAHPAAAGADLVMLLGCRSFIEFEPDPAPATPPGAKVVHTHVDAAEIGRVAAVDVAIVGDESLIVRGLLDRVPDGAGPGPEPATGVPRPWAPGDGDHATAADVAGALAEVIGARTTVVEDATTSAGVLLRTLPQPSPMSILTTASGSLGWGMGAALGVQLAAPDREVIAVVGDGVFQFGPQALWVARRYDLPVLFVVINNRSYAAVAAALRRYGGLAERTRTYPGKDIAGVDIAAVARGFGLPARRVTRPADLPGALKEFLSRREPALIEVLTDPDDLGGAPR